MGIATRLQDERGGVIDEVFDPHNILHSLLPTDDSTDFELLKYVDWWGNTVFNRLQMPEFLEEWARIEDKATSAEAKQLHSHIKEMATVCGREPHLYLFFNGD